MRGAQGAGVKQLMAQTPIGRVRGVRFWEKVYGSGDR